MPFVDNSSYTFFQAVKAFGAVGDSVTDNTAAINRAISEGQRCGLTTECSAGAWSASAADIPFHLTQIF